MRVGLFHLAQGTRRFDPAPKTLENFRAFGPFEGAPILERREEVGEVASILEGARTEPAFRPVSIPGAFAIAGGSSSAPTRARPKARFLHAVGGPFDGILLQPHGASAAEDELDVDGRTVALCRAQLGPEVPILLSLDHHAGLTRRMVEGATAIFAHRSQPHDLRETGRIGTRLPIRIRREGLRPVIARRRPLAAHREQFTTDRPPMRTRFERTPAMETRDGVPTAATFPMQPWLDVPEAGWAVAVTTDADPALAEARAEELADLAWSLRHDVQRRESLRVPAALDRALGEPPGLVALSDTVRGGAAGGTPVLLEAILARGAGPAPVPLAAPATVAGAHAAAPGARLELALGGELSGFFRPLTVEARVRRLGTGPLRLPIQWQDEIDHGRVALLEVAHAFVLASERRGAGGVSPELWRAFGVEPAAARVAVLKTAANFQYFRPIAVEVVRADTPGPARSDLASLPFRRLPRPLFPFDPIDDWWSVGP